MGKYRFVFNVTVNVIKTCLFIIIVMVKEYGRLFIFNFLTNELL